MHTREGSCSSGKHKDPKSEILAIKDTLKIVSEDSKIGSKGKFEKFLGSAADKAGRLIFPLLTASFSVGANFVACGPVYAALGAIATLCTVGSSMAKSYKTQKALKMMMDNEGSGEQDYSEPVRIEDAIADTVTREIQECMKTFTNTIKEDLKKVEKLLVDMKLDVDIIKNQPNLKIEKAYTVYRQRILKGEYSQALKELGELNLYDMYVSSDLENDTAWNLVQKAKETDLEEGCRVFFYLLGLRNKLEALQQGFFFLNDIRNGKKNQMEDYANGSVGTTYQNDMEHYWEIYKDLLDVKIPTVLVLGKTGTGKSSLCNVLAGKPHNADSLSGGFPVSNEPDACTETTTIGDFCFLGDYTRPVTIIDSPGFDDPRRQTSDAEIVSNIVEVLQRDVEGISLILIAVNGQTPRLENSLQAMIKIFEGMFTPDIWKHIALIFTRVKMDRENWDERNEENKNFDEDFAAEYIRKVQRIFENSQAVELPYFYIDSKYRKKDYLAVEKFQDTTHRLWELLQSKEKFPTDMVRKILEENEELKQVRDVLMRDYVRMQREIEINQEQLLDDTRKPVKGFTFMTQKEPPLKINKYDDYILKVCKKYEINPFRSREEFFRLYELIRDELRGGCFKVEMNPEIQSSAVLLDKIPDGSFVTSSPSSVVLILEVTNATNYNMIGNTLSIRDGYKQPLIVWENNQDYLSTDPLRVTELRSFNSFIIPPFSTERLVFRKDRFYGGLKGFATFSMTDFQLNSSLQNVFVMWNIPGNIRHYLLSSEVSFATGFPAINWQEENWRRVFTSNNEVNDSFIKSFVSPKVAKIKNNELKKLSWPRSEEGSLFDMQFTHGTTLRNYTSLIVHQRRTPSTLQLEQD